MGLGTGCLDHGQSVQLLLHAFRLQRKDLQLYFKAFPTLQLTSPQVQNRNYTTGMQADSNLAPVSFAQVWEVKCADISISPVHKASMGIVYPDKGVSTGLGCIHMQCTHAGSLRQWPYVPQVRLEGCHYLQA